MRFSFALAAALLGLTNADFDLYVGDDVSPGFAFNVWYIHQSPPDCNRVTNHARSYTESDDVSGRTLGVRCEGMGCHRNQPENVDQLEMHFSNKPLYHWTIYKNRGHPYKMYGLDGKTYGECVIFPGDTFECGNAFGGMKSGVRMFRCYTQWSVAAIESGSY